MVWQKADNAYLGATVAAGALAASMIAMNFGLGHGSGDLKTHPLGLGHLPLPLVAQIPKANSPSLRVRFVVRREVVRVPITPAAATSVPPAPSTTVGAVVAPPRSTVVPTVRPVFSPAPVPTETPALKKAKHHGPKPKKDEPGDASDRI